MNDVRTLLSDDGKVAARLSRYEERPQQIALGEAIERAMTERRHLLAEAGTGVGKSFAYLIPAVVHACNHRSAGPVVVSTKTIALQQQLESVDLPFLRSVLPLEWSVVTAVGRNNYVCLRRMYAAQAERGVLFSDPDHERQLRQVVEWSVSTREGTRMDLPTAIHPTVWAEVQAEHGNCLNRACPHYEPCHYQRSRRRQDGAHILIVNHALYMADVALRMAGASYLPAHEVVIFDEAHHLERAATDGLGIRLSEASVKWHLQRLHPRNPTRSLLTNYGTPQAMQLVSEVRDASASFFAALQGDLARRGNTLALEQRPLAGAPIDLLGDLAAEVTAIASGVNKLDRQMELRARAAGLVNLQTALQLMSSGNDASLVRWLESDSNGPVLRAAPLDVGETLREHVFDHPRTAILVSATLGDGADCDFRWLRRQLGIDDCERMRLGSPFDFKHAVDLVIEEALPDPGRDAPAFYRESMERILDHILDNDGRALVLCTSWSFVRDLADFLRPRLERASIPLLVQAKSRIAEQLQAKRAQPRSVLIGTDSLWEGIDIPGDALTLLIVTRLPFSPPDHPLSRARKRAIEQRGGDAFAEFSLPEAILRFRQGFGRLIRSGHDRGKVVVLDPRVRTRGYGRSFLAALPEGTLDGR